MGSKVFVTYKRKRLFSRSDHPHINLCSDASLKVLESKPPACFNKNEETISVHEQPDMDKESSFHDEYIKDKVGESISQCEVCDFKCHGQCSEHASKRQKLFSDCNKQSNPPTSDGTQNPRALEQKRQSHNFDSAQVTVNPNVILEGVPEERCQIGSAVQSHPEGTDTQSQLLFMKSSSECQDKAKDLVTVNPNVVLEGVPGARCQIDSSGQSHPDGKSNDSQSQLLPVKLGSESLDKTKEPVTDTLNVILEGVPGQRCHIDSTGQSHPEGKSTGSQSRSLLVESGPECQDKFKKPFLGKFNFNQPGSTLLTFCRRNKQKRDIVAPAIASQNTDTVCASEKPHGDGSSMDPKNNNITDLTNSFIGNEEKDSHEKVSSLQGKVVMDIQDDYQVNQLDVRSRSVKNEDLNISRLCSDVPEERGSLSSLSLSISAPAAFRDIDCNIPFDCGSDRNHPPGPLEVVHDSLGSTSKLKETMRTLQRQCTENGSLLAAKVDKGKSPIDPLPVLRGRLVAANVDKGKSPVDPLPVLTGPSVAAKSDKGKSPVDPQPVVMDTSSKNNNYLQLFPDGTSSHILELANNPQKLPTFPFPEEKRSQLKSSLNHGACLQPEQTVNSHHPYYSSLYQWPNIHMQPREAFQDAHSLSSRHRMMLDNILTRARAVRGNRSSFLDKFELPPTAWSEEELDSLWIGVRRHGKGNWDAILRDRRLNFSPWKTTKDLADRWQEEQNRLVYGPPLSHVKYPTLQELHPNPAVDLMNVPRSTQLQTHWSTLSPYSFMKGNATRLDESSSGGGGPAMGSLPHWLREAVIPPGPWGQTQKPISPSLNSIYSNIQSTNADTGGKAPSTNAPLAIGRRETEPCGSGITKQDELIVIQSDASSEETVSDDHSIRPSATS